MNEKQVKCENCQEERPASQCIVFTIATEQGVLLDRSVTCWECGSKAAKDLGLDPGRKPKGD